MRPFRLQLRMVSIFLTLLFAVQAAGYLLIHEGLLGNAHLHVDAQIASGHEVARHLYDERQLELRQHAARLSADAAFIGAWNLGDRARLRQALRRLQADGGAAQVWVLDRNLKPLAVLPDAEAELPPGLASWLTRATEPAGVVQILPATQPGARSLKIWIAAPLRAQGVQGWLLRGGWLDDAALARVRKLAQVDVAVAVRGHPAQSWQLRAATIPAEARLALEAGLGGLGGRTGASSTEGPPLDLDLPGASYRTRVRNLPVVGAGESAQAALLVLGSVDEALAPYRRMQWALLGLGGLGLAVFGVGAVLSARRITRPLAELAGSARRLSEGHYEQSVPVRSADEIGELAQAFETMRTAVAQREAEIRRLAFRDALTDLPNREQFRLSLRQAVARALAGDHGCAVLMLDLDRFKHVNDVLGHRFGDRLLKIVARRLREQAVSSTDLLARLGGDEFVVLIDQGDAEAAQAVGQRILRAFEQPLTLDEQTVDLGASIGIALCPAHGTHADQLLARAEIAMYAAKRRQAGSLVYQPELDSSSQESLSLLGELRRAIDQGELRVVLQPQVDLADSRLTGAEALLRWKHPQRGLLLPLDFIPFAEQTGFIRLLTGWMIEQLCRIQRELVDQGLDLRLSMNLSTRDLLAPDLAEQVARHARACRIDPRSLVLEITESAMMDDPQRTMQTLMKLHEMGVRLSIDDFGVGYSSLGYLKRLPVQELKIDQSFVRNMGADLDDAKIVRSTIDLAHNLGLGVVAEGVETARLWKMLAALGCDQGQGYFIARPMPADLFVDWARQWRAPELGAERLSTDFTALV